MFTFGLSTYSLCQTCRWQYHNAHGLLKPWLLHTLFETKVSKDRCPYNLRSFWKSDPFWTARYFGWDHVVCVVFKISCPSIVSKQVVVVMFSSCCRLPSFGLCWRLAKTLTCLRLSPARLPPAIPTTTSTSLGKKLIWSFCFSAWKLHNMHERTGAIRSQFASNIASNIFSPAYAGYRMWLKRSIAHRASLFSTSITCAVFLYMCC